MLENISQSIFTIIPFAALVILLGYIVFSFKLGEHRLTPAYDIDTQYKHFMRLGLIFGLPKLICFFLVLLVSKVKPDWLGNWLYASHSWLFYPTVGAIAIGLMTFILALTDFRIFLGEFREFLTQKKWSIAIRIISYAVIYYSFCCFCYSIVQFDILGFPEKTQSLVKGACFFLVSLGIIVTESSLLTAPTRNLVRIRYIMPDAQLQPERFIIEDYDLPKNQGQNETIDKTPPPQQETSDTEIDQNTSNTHQPSANLNIQEISDYFRGTVIYEITGFLMMRYKSGDFLLLQREDNEPRNGKYRFISIPTQGPWVVDVQIFDQNVFDAEKRLENTQNNVRNARKTL